MRQVLRLALNDLRLTARDRMSAFWMLVLPVGFMWFFGFMAGGEGETPQIDLGVVDRDGGWLAAALTAELRDDAVNLTPFAADWEPFAPEAEQRSRWVVIPEGFTAGVLAGEQQTLDLVRHPDASEQYTAAAQAHVVRAIARLLAALVELETGEEAPLALPSGEMVPPSYQALTGRPPQVSLEVSSAGRGRPVPSGYGQSVPGILTMTVLMMTVIYGGVFLTAEKSEGMIRRQVTAPLGRGPIFAGKLAGRLLIAGVQIALLILVGRFMYGISWGASPLGLLLVLVSYGAAVAGLAMLLGAVLRTPEQASSVGWIVSMVLAALGGCWWPSEVMPAWLRSAAHVLPTTWAMDAFHALVSWGQGLEAVLLPSAVLLGFALLFGALGARFLRYD
jgi:ABC-type multidrug transport system permease subunit